MTDSFIRGNLNGGNFQHGDIVGPTEFGEFLVYKTNGFVGSFWTATEDDFERMMLREPRTLTEWNIQLKPSEVGRFWMGVGVDASGEA